MAVRTGTPWLAAGLGAAALALAACAGGAPRVAPQLPLPVRVDDGTVRDLARQALAEVGLSAETLDVTRSFRTLSGDGSREVIDRYEVWARVPDCARGQAVVEVSPQGQIRQIYTRFGCEVPGIPAY